MKALLLSLIAAYRFLLSPWVGGQCRFSPTCSVYAEDAIGNYGALAGTYLGAKRLLRCHPWCEGGWDPVPAQWSWGHAGVPEAHQDVAEHQSETADR
jgi:putative membrane protein insertion efficiency factor